MEDRKWKVSFKNASKELVPEITKGWSRFCAAALGRDGVLQYNVTEVECSTPC